MNKLFVCFAFCTLNSFSMHKSFLDALSPENVVENAVHSLFSGPLPIVTRADMDARRAEREKKESSNPVNDFKTTAPEVTESEIQSKKFQLRRLISLNEAITLGKFNAVEDETRGKVIEFEDFETTPQLRLVPFYASLDEVNAHIYTTLAQLNQLTHAEKVKNKILINPEAPLAEEEYLAYQSYHAVGFLTNEDLNQFKIQMSKRLQDEAELSQDDAKQDKQSQVAKNVADIFLSRAKYLAAFAAHDITAINIEKNKSHYPHSIFSQTLKEEIEEFRQQARDAHASIRAMLFIDDQDHQLASATESALRMYHEHHEG